MAFTDSCDIFASFHEEGFNRILGHVRRQRPSLFNYATADVANNPRLLCKEIGVHPIVALRNNPQVTLKDATAIKRFGEAVLGVIVAEPGQSPDLQAIDQVLRGSLARFKQPKALKIVAALPRNTMGKVQKNLLRDTHRALFAG